MKRILLCCAAGMSTSLLVQRIKKVAEEEHYECDVEAVPFKIDEPKIAEADVVLLGPQVRYNLGKLQERYPDIPSGSIDMIAYGMCNGAAILKQARDLMGE
ncbi:MAG: PTS sugar transporter subunit IIB [Erysipelotrichaceae bacterium]|nr:PTS sugar transporter subunit IIB [Erysipelotrichaceae bacterium]